MKYILLFIATFTVTSYPVNDDVYICDSKGAKRYHLSKDCRGLYNCKAEIKTVTPDDAKKRGKTLCGYED